MSMLHPSYKEMIEKMNADAQNKPDAAEISSRYSLVIAAAKRARQINAGAEPLVEAGEKEKNLSVAVREIYNDQVHVLTEEARRAEEAAEEDPEETDDETETENETEA